MFRIILVCVLAGLLALPLVACGGDDSAQVARGFIDDLVNKYDVNAAMKRVDDTGKTQIDRAAAEQQLEQMMPRLKIFDTRDLRVELADTQTPPAELQARGVREVKVYRGLYAIRSGDTGGAFVPVQATVTVAQVDGRWVVAGFDIPTEARR